MSKENEIPSRVYRILCVKRIDEWFYEPHCSTRTHRKAFGLFVRPLLGICESSFNNYRRHRIEASEGIALPPHIEFALWLSVQTVKYLPSAETEQALRLLRRAVVKSFREAERKLNNKPFDARIWLASLAHTLDEMV